MTMLPPSTNWLEGTPAKITILKDSEAENYSSHAFTGGGSFPATGGLETWASTFAEGPSEESESNNKAMNAGVATSGLKSIGSALHQSGTCRPCAWIHKPQGCSNGAACRHCHLCDEDAVKIRRKAKCALFRKAAEQDGKIVSEVKEVEEPPTQQPERLQLQVIVPPSPLSSFASFPDPMGSQWTCVPMPPGLSVSPPKVESPMVEGLAPRSEHAVEASEEVVDSGAATGDLPSVGSALHGTGACRPCAWFYKETGCANGKDCRHCHACQEGEVKARKKEKASLRQAMNKEAAAQEATGEDQVNVQTWQDSFGSFEYAALVESLPFMPVPGPMPPMPMIVPSIGSNLHLSGLCRPCAWFWKASGCANGRDCYHCHLCPDGAITARKKMKLDALHLAQKNHLGGMEAAQPTSPAKVKQFLESLADKKRLSKTLSPLHSAEPLGMPMTVTLSDSRVSAPDRFGFYTWSGS